MKHLITEHELQSGGTVHHFNLSRGQQTTPTHPSTKPQNLHGKSSFFFEDDLEASNMKSWSIPMKTGIFGDFLSIWCLNKIDNKHSFSSLNYIFNRMFYFLLFIR